MGAVRRPCGLGAPAARQRSASRLQLPRCLVPRPPGRSGLRHTRRHLAGFARRGAGPQRHDRLGPHDDEPRQPGRLRRACRSDRPQPLHHARRRPPLRGPRRDDQGRLGRSHHDARARDAARAGDRRLRPPRRQPHAAGTRAGPAGDRTRWRRYFGRGLQPHRLGAELGGFPVGGPSHRLADAEHGLCRHVGEYRPDLAGARPDPAQG